MSNASAAKLIEYSEEERRRLARELHDDISQRLALLADDADRIRREVVWTDEASRYRLDNLVQRARSLAEDLRRISHSLHPAIVEDLGLAAAIRSLSTEFAENSGLPATLVASNLPLYVPLAVSTVFYRIVQEALRNVSKHAGDTAVRITLNGQPGEIVLVVADSGTGFDMHDCPGLGLISMRERAHLAGGTFTVKSAPGKGTTIEVHMPVTKTQSD